METKRFIYYEEDGLFVGWLEEYPDYRTQGETMDQLQENLLDIHRELVSGEIPHVRKVGELSIA
jgi:predicted RNase H-like HicB family nuclease